MEQEVNKTNGLVFLKLENQKIPEFKQVRGKEWVFWGQKNDYPDYLIELFMRSSTHNAIITGKADYLLGEGWRANKTGLPTDKEAVLNSFINKINKDETLEELSEKVFLDFEIFNAIALEVIWNRSKRDFELYHVPFNKIRTNEDESKYWFSNDWTNSVQNEEKTGLKEFKPFDFKENENGLFVYKIIAPRKGKDPNVYPVPGYIGSTQAIETDAECSNYNLSEIKTGFSAGTILNFYNGVPDQEKMDAIEKKIKEKFSGTDRAGGIILNFADGKERGSEVVALSGNDLDKRYIELKKDVRQEIFTGHKVSSPMLFGVKTEGQLGGRSEIVESDELFQNKYVAKRQRLMQKVFNQFVKLKGLTGSLKLMPTQSVANDIFTESTIVANLPAAAIRDIIAERMGIDLSKYENKGVTTVTQETTQLSKHKEIATNLIAKFATIGRPKSDYNIFKSTCLFHADSFSVAKAEQEYFAKKDKLSSLDRSIIDLISKDEKIPASELAKALKTDVKTIEGRLKDLVDSEYISPSTEGYSPTDEGIDIVEDEGAKTINVEILYSYELRPNAPKLLGESREFCSELIKLDLLYTRAEIDNLSNEFGTDVWTFKGGWYTNPNTDAPTPQCRHTFVQHVVKRK